MTRIRYNKLEDGTLVSRRVFTINGVDVFVKINPTTMTYIIYEATNSDNILKAGGSTKSLTVLKTQAKDGLRELGYEFTGETRERGLPTGTTTVANITSVAAATIDA